MSTNFEAMLRKNAKGVNVGSVEIPLQNLNAFLDVIALRISTGRIVVNTDGLYLE